MKNIVIVLCLLFAFKLQATEFEIKESAIKKPTSTTSPINLIHYDDDMMIYTKGTTQYFTARSVDYLDKNLKLIKSIPIPTKLTDRADHMFWTGEKLIVFWEKRVKNDRQLSIQTFDKNGISTPRKVLEQLENSYSVMLNDQETFIFSSENKKYHAIVQHNSWTKGFNLKKKNHNLFTLVLDEKGNILYQNTSRTVDIFPDLGVMELSNEGELMNFMFNEKGVKIAKFDVISKKSDTTELQINLPENIKETGGYVNTYFNLKDQTIDFFGRGYKEGDKGFSGEYFIRYDKKNNKLIHTKYYNYDQSFIDSYEKSKEVWSGNLVFNDGTFSLRMLQRDIYKRPNGGYYLIKEFYSTDVGIKTDNLTYYILDFLITAYDAEGNVEWTKRVPKSQEVFHSEFGFFNSFLDKDDLYLVYNESAKNLNKDLDDDFEKTNLVLGDIKPIIRKIDFNGNIETFDISEQLKSKFTFSPSFSKNFHSPYSGIATIAKKKARTPLTEYNLIRIQIKE